MGCRILIVEDEPEISSLLQRGLAEEGYSAEVTNTGASAMRQFNEGWDLVILDLMLPDIAGETVLDFITQRRDHPPVLILSARAQLVDKLTLFERGCDDYLTKPFAIEELLSRVRALLRRAPKAVVDEGRYEDMYLESETLRCFADERSITLTPKEFAICRLLMREPGKVISKRQLIRSVWGVTQEPKTNYIEVHLANLRKKLSQLGRDEWLQTVRSSGFLFSRPEEI